MLVDDGPPRTRRTAVGRRHETSGVYRFPPTIQALLAARLDQLGLGGARPRSRAAAVRRPGLSPGINRDADNPADGPRCWRFARCARPQGARSGQGHPSSQATCLSLPPPADPGRSVRGDPETGPRRPARTARRWLEAKAGERSGEYDEIIGYHLEQAFRYHADLGTLDGDSRALGRRAAERLGTAGRRAFLRSDALAGVNLISRAVAMLSPADPLRVDLVPNVRAVQGITDLTWADRVLTEAVEAAATTGDRQLAAHALVQRGFLRLFNGAEVTPGELIDVSKRAIAAFDEFHDELGLARAWRLVAQAHYLDRDMQSCADASERALEHVRRAGDRFEEREIVEWLVITLLLGPAPAPDAIRRFERLLGEVGDDPFLQAEILGGLAPLMAMQGRQAEADDIVARGGTIMEESGEWVWIVFFWRASIHLWRGDASAAEQELRPAYEMLKRIGEQSHFSSLAHALANVLYAQGLYADAEQMTRECEGASRPNDVHSRSSGARSGRRRSRAETRSTTHWCSHARRSCSPRKVTSFLLTRTRSQTSPKCCALRAGRPPRAPRSKTRSSSTNKRGTCSRSDERAPRSTDTRRTDTRRTAAAGRSFLHISTFLAPVTWSGYRRGRSGCCRPVALPRGRWSPSPDQGQFGSPCLPLIAARAG